MNNLKQKDHKEKKRVVCYTCNKKTLKSYNFTKQKWVTKFKCSCGSESFQWYN